MKTPQQIRNEVEKGCGVVFGDCYYEDMNPRECGKDKIHYCKECRDRINILTEYDKSIKEMIEELKEKLEGEEYRDDEYTSYRNFMNGQISQIIDEELLSKIGEEKQDE